MTLTLEQQKHFENIERTTNNYFVTGKPGVGKSVLINHLVSHGLKHYTLTAPTGLAALNIGGRTLHSLFKLPVSEGVIQPDYNRFTEDERCIANIRYNIHCLIVDEISMVRADMLDYIDRLLRHVRNIDKPFGGIQVVAVGDFFQLPPVVIGPETSHLKLMGYNTPFAFSARVFKEANFIICPLTEVLRQKDDKPFIKLLHDARAGNIKIPQVTKLNKLVGRHDDLRICLCGINKQADAINQQHLKAIDWPEFLFTAKIFGEWPAYPTEKELRLKVGAQVMVKRNGADREPCDSSKDFQSRVVNGSMGVVVDFVENYVVIKLDNNEEVKIYNKTWEKTVKKKVNDKWEEVVVASFEQMPLALAWAISIHKSQGQSFDKVFIDPSKIFIEGQMYVALSRCRTLQGIRFASNLNLRKFTVNEHVVEFYKQIKV
jgi:ATP-dependent DNA helicase PIF1